MTPVHRIEAVLTEDGKSLLPFRVGQTVEVIVAPAVHTASLVDGLQGTVLHYDEPTLPVAQDDWRALN